MKNISSNIKWINIVFSIIFIGCMAVIMNVSDGFSLVSLVLSILLFVAAIAVVVVNAISFSQTRKDRDNERSVKREE